MTDKPAQLDAAAVHELFTARKYAQIADLREAGALDDLLAGVTPEEDDK